MKNKNLKENKAITLIALVITIIVLLLLAGISISMLSGQDGILTKASDAKSKTQIAEEKDIVNMGRIEAQMSEYTDKAMTQEEIIEKLGSKNEWEEDRFSSYQPYGNNVKEIVGNVPIPIGMSILKGGKYDKGCYVVDSLGNVYKWVNSWIGYFDYNRYDGYWVVEEAATVCDDWKSCPDHFPYCWTCGGQENPICRTDYCNEGDCDFPTGECDGGTFTCLNCLGAGVIFKSYNCPDCGYEVDSEGYCYTCHQKKEMETIECGECKGEKIIVCPNCSGKGVCPKCKGNGYLDGCEDCGGESSKNCECCGSKIGYIYIL